MNQEQADALEQIGMTSRQKVRQLFHDLGIPYSERINTSQSYVSEEGVTNASAWETAIDIQEGIGLPGFRASFYFDSEEAFLAHRIWKKP